MHHHSTDPTKQTPVSLGAHQHHASILHASPAAPSQQGKGRILCRISSPWAVQPAYSSQTRAWLRAEQLPKAQTDCTTGTALAWWCSSALEISSPASPPANVQSSLQLLHTYPCSQQWHSTIPTAGHGWPLCPRAHPEGAGGHRQTLPALFTVQMEKGHNERAEGAQSRQHVLHQALPSALRAVHGEQQHKHGWERCCAAGRVQHPWQQRMEQDGAATQHTGIPQQRLQQWPTPAATRPHRAGIPSHPSLIPCDTPWVDRSPPGSPAPSWHTRASRARGSHILQQEDLPRFLPRMSRTAPRMVSLYRTWCATGEALLMAGTVWRERPGLRPQRSTAGSTQLSTLQGDAAGPTAGTQLSHGALSLG